METRVCKICKKELPLNYFREHSQSKDGYLHTCKDCQKIRKLQRNEIKLELKEQENYSRICHVCNKLLDISHFSLDRRSNDGRRWLCKECEVLHNSINQGNNIQIISMKANTMKNSATPEELKKFCKNVLRYSLNNYENN